jgi:hypothetical protein
MTVTAVSRRPRTAAASPAQDPRDLERVVVELPAGKGRRTRIGTAAQALADRRLTASERAAVLALVEAVRLLRERAGLAGIDDAGAAVHLLLRDADANAGGPWATNGQVAVGTRNALAARTGGRARTDVLLTVDAAVHELTHVVQFGRMSDSAKPDPAILEGIADAAAILATGDDTLGEEFFRRDASGRYRGSIRELGGHDTSGPALAGVVTRYQDAIRPGTEEHAGGGVVSATFRTLRAHLGRERAEQLLWAVIRDAQAWRDGGSWRELVLAIRRQAGSVWAGDSAALDAVEGALRATGLDAAA